MKLSATCVRLARVLVIGVVVAGCTSSPGQQLPTSPASSLSAPSLDAAYRTGPIRFRYPSAWTAHKVGDQYLGEFSTPQVVVSDQLLDGYCTESAATKSCRAMPIRSLDAGGVVLQWSEHGFPGWTFASQDGRVINVDGRRAKITEHNAICGSMSADRSLTVVVTRPGISDNWYQLDACFREPGARPPSHKSWNSFRPFRSPVDR